MDLISQVLRAIESRPVNAAEFERCACVLLQKRYPGLSAVEGGHDLGRDGDIYFPLNDLDPEARGRLLATTGDPIANLRTGLNRMVKEGLRVDLIVMACLAPVNAGVRVKLDRLCEKWGLPRPHVYARDWFVGALVGEPDWRERLLGVRGGLSALLKQPLEELESPGVRSSAMVGRDSELAAVRELVDAHSDVVLVGVPGVGKTRLTSELGRSVAFLQRAEPSEVVDAVLAMRPSAVVVDDAHTRFEEIRALRRVRVQERASFSIVASTWPDRLADVAAQLPRAQQVLVDLLSLADMDALVRSVGVTGHRARATILRQAEGRPGWALTLCELLVNGDGLEVVQGTANVANVERFLRRATESQTAVDALACVAALGQVSTEMVHRMALLIDDRPAALVDLLSRLARNGLLDETEHGWALQPALRAPLIARWFFGSPAARPWSTLVDAFPEESAALTLAKIAAARTGSVPARAAADAWARSLPCADDLNWADLAHLAEYSTLDEEPARFAVTLAREVLVLRQSAHRADSGHDALENAAKTMFVTAARQWVQRDAVFALLDLAVDDQRPSHSTSDHPLKVLVDLPATIDPDFGPVFLIRERLLTFVLDWLAASPVGRRRTVGAEVLAGIFSPKVSGFWSAPGSPDTFEFSEGSDSAANLRRLMDMWPHVDEVLSSGEPWPPQAVGLLMTVAEKWLRLGAGFSSGQVNEDQQQVGTAGGLRIFEALRPLVQAVPGLALRAQRFLDDRRWVLTPSEARLTAFDVEQDLLDVVGSRHHGDDLQADLRERSGRVESLARRVLQLGPEAGVTRFLWLAAQVDLVGVGVAGYLSGLARCMGRHVDDPKGWCEQAALRGVPAILRAMLPSWLDHDPDSIPSALVVEYLRDPVLRAPVISAVLAKPDLDRISMLVIADLRADDVSLLDEWAIGRSPDDVLHALLVHPVPAVAAAAALIFSVGQEFGPELPDQWRNEWVEAVRTLSVGGLDVHATWRAGELLDHLAKHDPDLYEQWLANRLDDMKDLPYLKPIEPHGVEQNIAELPRPHRERLTRRYLGMTRTRIGHTLLTYLIGADHELADRLLSDHVIDVEDLLESMLGQRNDIFESLALLLLARGLPPELIATPAGYALTTYGSESVSHANAIEYFTSLAERVPQLRVVAEAGKAEHERKLREAEERERRELVRRR